MNLLSNPLLHGASYPPPEEISEDVELKDEVLGQLRRRMGVDTPRSGIHASELIFCLRKGWAMRKVDELPGGRLSQLDETPDEQMLVWLIGHSHEALFGAGRIRGEAKELDGIIGTLDFWTRNELDAEKPLLTEMKSTRSSAKKTLAEMSHYMAQLATYCKMHGITEGHVWVLHIMGDYAHQTREGKAKGVGPAAMLKVWKVRWSNRTLDMWWSELQQRKELLVGTEMPAAQPYFEWECGYCSVRELINCPGSPEYQRTHVKGQQLVEL